MILVFILLISVSSTALAASAQNNTQTVNESQINISKYEKRKTKWLFLSNCLLAILCFYSFISLF